MNYEKLFNDLIVSNFFITNYLGEELLESGWTAS